MVRYNRKILIFEKKFNSSISINYLVRKYVIKINLKMSMVN